MYLVVVLGEGFFLFLVIKDMCHVSVRWFHVVYFSDEIIRKIFAVVI